MKCDTISLKQQKCSYMIDSGARPKTKVTIHHRCPSNKQQNHAIATHLSSIFSDRKPKIRLDLCPFWYLARPKPNVLLMHLNIQKWMIILCIYLLIIDGRNILARNQFDNTSIYESFGLSDESTGVYYESNGLCKQYIQIVGIFGSVVWLYLSLSLCVCAQFYIWMKCNRIFEITLCWLFFEMEWMIYYNFKLFCINWITSFSAIFLSLSPHRSYYANNIKLLPNAICFIKKNHALSILEISSLFH